MTPQIFPVPGPWRGSLAISTRPRGGDWLEDEVHGWHTAGVDAVVSLLEEDEERDLDLIDEGLAARKEGLQFISFPIVDRGVPRSTDAVVPLLRDLNSKLGTGNTVVVHCRQGIGRSALIAAGLLVTSGIDPATAIHTVAEARGLAVPETQEQRRWIEELSKHLVMAG